jgi:hypothetical protein
MLLLEREEPILELKLSRPNAAHKAAKRRINDLISFKNLVAASVTASGRGALLLRDRD